MKTKFMLHKNSTSNDLNENTFPFTEKQLRKFESEINRAGNFHALMEEKYALQIKDGEEVMQHYYDVEGYKKRYLIGVYELLRPMYDTDIPYLFWSDMHKILQKLNGESE